MKLTAEIVKKLALQVGFDLCGITEPDVITEAKSFYAKWLHLGYQAEMKWLERNQKRRTDPSELMDGVKSVIMLGLNYYQDDTEAVLDGYGKVSKYARGKDYHKVIKKKTEHLLTKLAEYTPGPNKLDNFKWWVDYGPFLERSYAEKAGLGYVGKNGMLINKQFGSWLFISEIVTTVELQPDKPSDLEHGKCATCRICIDACPTEAIVKPRLVDSNRCISYLTIERPETIPEELQSKMGNWLFGCDVCQDVCPHNLSRSQITKHDELKASSGVGEIVALEKILSMRSRDDFLKLTARTPLTRPKEDGLKRNAEIVKKNQIVGKVS